MEGSKIYFAACLLSTLYTVCTSYCPSWQVSYKDCSRYYNAIEAALLKDQFNKYQLHEEFFPSSHSEPLYGSAYYNLTVNGIPVTSYAIISMFWSSSFILTYINPFALNNLQLRLIKLLFVRTGVLYRSSTYYDIFSNTVQNYSIRIVQLKLTLDVDMDIPEKDAKVVLMDFTSWVSSYLPGLLCMAVIDKEKNAISLNIPRQRS